MKRKSEVFPKHLKFSKRIFASQLKKNPNHVLFPIKEETKVRYYEDFHTDIQTQTVETVVNMS